MIDTMHALSLLPSSICSHRIDFEKLPKCNFKREIVSLVLFAHFNRLSINYDICKLTHCTKAIAMASNHCGKESFSFVFLKISLGNDNEVRLLHDCSFAIKV